jgi:hypothetical protein
MAFKMKYKNLEEVVKQLKGAVKAHGKQAKIIEEHIDDMGEKSPLEKRGSWEYGGKTYYGDYKGKYSKYWNREWYDFKFGVNYIIR